MPNPIFNPTEMAQFAEIAAMAANPEIRDRLSERGSNLLQQTVRHGREVYSGCTMFRRFPDTGRFARQHYKKHVAFMAAGKYAKERAFIAGNRTGKALLDSEPIPTPAGFREMGSLRVGDYVLGSNGHPTRVIGVYPQGEREVYRVTATDDATVLCSGDHLWPVRKSTSKGARKKPLRLRTTHELWESGRRYELPPRPLSFGTGGTEVEGSSLDPYFLGLMLGDGGLTGGIPIITTMDPEVAEHCRGVAAEFGCKLRPADVSGKAVSYHFPSKTKGRRNDLTHELRRIGVHGCSSHEKFIPPQYLHAPWRDRLALLQGLMDTDGTVDGRGGTQGTSRSFSSVSRSLAEGVQRLARSLGMAATLKRKKGTYKGETHWSWRVNIFCGGKSLFRMKRKRKLERASWREKRNIRIKRVERLGILASMTCIRVESEDGIFLAGDGYIPTHNTETCSFEDAVHLTGLYPDWWPGRKFNEPVKWLVSGLSNESTRDILVPALLGSVRQADGRNYVDGTGMIPGVHFVPGTLVFRGGTGRIVSGIDIYYRDSKEEYSTLKIMSNHMGWAAYSGTFYHGVHLDEEHDLMVYSECITRTMTTEGIVMSSFTPLAGVTSMIKRILPGYRENVAIEERVFDPASGTFSDSTMQEEVTLTDDELKEFENVMADGSIVRKADGLGQWVTNDLYVMQVGWKDRPPHLPEAEMKRRYNSVPPHLRSAVADGVPSPATGRVYPIDIGLIKVKPFQIPDHWPRAFALDPGWRVTGVLWGAYNPDEECWYIYGEYKEGQAPPDVHTRRIRGRGDWIPGVVDPAGLASSLNDGISVVERYRHEGLILTPAVNSVSLGIETLYSLLINHQFKIFSTLEKFENEFLTYRYNYKPDSTNEQGYGKPVKANDHLMDAARYLVMSGLSVATTRARAMLKRGRISGWSQEGGQYGDSVAGY